MSLEPDQNPADAAARCLGMLLGAVLLLRMAKEASAMAGDASLTHVLAEISSRAWDLWVERNSETDRCEGNVKSPVYRRPDTYAAAAALIGVTRAHAYSIVTGRRVTTPEKERALAAWARENAAKGRGDAPAVAAALRTLAA